MKNIGVFYLKSLGFLEVNFSIYLNRRVFVMNNAGNGSLCRSCLLKQLQQKLTRHPPLGNGLVQRVVIEESTQHKWVKKGICWKCYTQQKVYVFLQF